MKKKTKDVREERVNCEFGDIVLRPIFRNLALKVGGDFSEVVKMLKNMSRQSKMSFARDGHIDIMGYDITTDDLDVVSGLSDFVDLVYAYKVNPNEPTAEDLDCSKLTPETFDRRFQ